MNCIKFFTVFVLTLFFTDSVVSQSLNNTKHTGYRGIWYELGQISDRYVGDKNSGGLSFCCGHTLEPMAIYSPEVDKTFFVYGGTTEQEERHLLIMASYYDHANHRVPKPTIVRDQLGVNDPHDNPSITIDEDGYIWIFIAGRGRHRPGQIFKATKPFSVDEFELVIEREQTYSQIWYVPGKGFMHLLTLYTGVRELYWETSANGDDWTPEPAKDLQKFAGIEGHYRVSRIDQSKQRIGQAFNYHPDGKPNNRTNVYYAETKDFGKTWTTISGQELSLPLVNRDNPALVTDYESVGRMAYIQQLLFDDDGNPVILLVTSEGYEPGPKNDPRIWEIIRWTGEKWLTHEITRSDHNYDMGIPYINGDRWALIAPALPGPQPYYTGGEIGLWVSYNKGETWRLEREVTRNSPRNNGYIRRPHNPVDPFFAMWTDGNSAQFSISHLYFTNSNGTRVYMLPYTMEGDYAEPILLVPPTPPGE